MRNLKPNYSKVVTISLVLIAFVPNGVWGECTCDVEDEQHNKSESLKFKLVGIASVLVAGAIGVSLPQLGKKIDILRPENDIFFMVKAFAAGVILATGFVHILSDAFDSLTSPCLGKNLWGEFPFTGFIAMVSSIVTLMVDSFATTFYKRMHFKHKQMNDDEEMMADGQHIHVQVHTHASNGHGHGHAHGSSIPSSEMDSSADLIRRRIISKVLELGIVVHSVIIGVSLGASQSPSTIKPLLVALSFHQFFEGMGLGGCIVQAKFKSLSTRIMALFFSLTTPVGIAIGIGISNIYNENSQTALIVEGTFNSASAGILIYMALVDLLAADFRNRRMQEDWRVQVGANVSLLLGAACMSVMAKWA